MSRTPGSHSGLQVPQWLLITIALGVIIARLHLRINIKKQKLQRNDITMIIAWFGALAIGCIDARLASLGALQPHVSTILDGYEGSPDDIQFILRVKSLLSKLFSNELREMTN